MAWGEARSGGNIETARTGIEHLRSEHWPVAQAAMELSAAVAVYLFKGTSNNREAMERAKQKFDVIAGRVT